MNRQRKVVITTTYNEMGIIIDTKAEELDSSAQSELEQNLHNACTDLISRADALNCFRDWIDSHGDVHTADEMPEYQRIEQLPSAQPEPAIPLQWIEEQIEWLKSLDNAFSILTAGQLLAMVNKWKDEQDG